MSLRPRVQAVLAPAREREKTSCVWLLAWAVILREALARSSLILAIAIWLRGDAATDRMPPHRNSPRRPLTRRPARATRSRDEPRLAPGHGVRGSSGGRGRTCDVVPD